MKDNCKEESSRGILLEKHIPLHINKEVLNKIKYLCSIISEVEWSGILLYSTEGNIKHPDTYKIYLKDIILMNKGDKTTTGYQFNEQKRDQSGYEDRHIKYCDEREEAIYWNIGMIHSHNTMKTFFSGVDMAELADNCPAHNSYLSLIVNNRMDFKAKVAVAAKIELSTKQKFKALDSEGIEYEIPGEHNISYSETKMFVYDCDIIYNKEDFEELDPFIKNVLDVLQNSSKNNYNSFSKYENNWERAYQGPVVNTLYNNNNNNTLNKNYYEDYEEDFYGKDIENFFKLLLNNTKMTNPGISVNGILYNLSQRGVNPNKLASNIIDNYVSVYQIYYSDFEDDNEIFEDVLDSVIDLVDDHLIGYKYLLTPTHKALIGFSKEYKKLKKD